jgi:zinc protease
MSYAIYNPDNKAKLESAWNEELAKMLKDGFTEAELKAAKTGILQYRQTGRTDDGQLAGNLENQLFLNRTMDWDKNMDDQFQKLTVDQVNVAMKKYLYSNKISFVKAGDFK